MHPTRHVRWDARCHTLPNIFGCVPLTGARNHFIDLKIYNKHHLRVLVKLNQIESNFYEISVFPQILVCVCPSQSSPCWESSGACMDTSSSLGTPFCSGADTAGPFTPIGAWHKVSSFCHGEGSGVCRNSSCHPALVSMYLSLEKGSDSSFSNLHLSSQL